MKEAGGAEGRKPANLSKGPALLRAGHGTRGLVVQARGCGASKNAAIPETQMRLLPGERIALNPATPFTGESAYLLRTACLAPPAGLTSRSRPRRLNRGDSSQDGRSSAGSHRASPPP